MMPILHCLGVMMPGQLGPMSWVPFLAKNSFTRIMSSTGMCSVMSTTSLTPAAEASQAESAAPMAGTKTTLVSAPVALTASSQELKTGTPSTSWPPLPGVTPATTLVPYFIICSAWKRPSRPVRPWTMTFVSELTRMLITPSR